MIDLLLEGAGSLRFGCTIGFVIPVIGLLLAAGRRAVVVVVTFVAVAGAIGWARFADWWPEPPGVVVLGLVAAFAALLVPLAAGDDLLGPRAGSTGDRPTRHTLAPLVLSASLASLVAGWLWVPCVGPHLSEPLNNAPDEPWPALAQVLVYVAGIATPLAAAALIPIAFPAVAGIRDHRVTRVVGLIGMVVVAGAVAIGWYSDLVVRFTPGAG